MRQLSGQDAAFIYGETPNWHMHISGLIIVDPSTAPDGWSFERFRELLIERLPEIPQLRWRLIETPMGLDRPHWVEAEDIDVDFHINRVGLPSPGGEQELSELVGRLIGRQLDRSRPLWEAWVIEGLEGGKIAILQKMHHATVDGISGAGLAEVLLDLTPDPRPPSGVQKDRLDDDRVPGDLELVGRALVNTAWKTPFRVARFMNQSIRQAAAAVPMLTDSAKSMSLPLTAPRTPFNTDPSPQRRFAAARIDLERVKAVKDAYGVKLNDVILALCSSSMRRYLLLHDAAPTATMLAQVPVSLRVSDDDSVGNKVGSMTVSLGSDIDDPAERLAVIHESSTNAKEMRTAMAAHQIMGMTETTPPGLLALAARMYTRNKLADVTPPASNVVISNVPGPTFDLYVAGGRVEAMYPMGPLLMGMSLNITVFSFGGSIDFGLMVCPEAVPDPEVLAEGIGLALEELEAAAP